MHKISTCATSLNTVFLSLPSLKFTNKYQLSMSRAYSLIDLTQTNTNSYFKMLVIDDSKHENNTESSSKMMNAYLRVLYLAKQGHVKFRNYLPTQNSHKNCLSFLSTPLQTRWHHFLQIPWHWIHGRYSFTYSR